MNDRIRGLLGQIAVLEDELQTVLHERANDALLRLRRGELQGAAVLVMRS